MFSRGSVQKYSFVSIWVMHCCVRLLFFGQESHAQFLLVLDLFWTLYVRSVPRSFRETEMRNWTQLLSIIETGIHDRLQPLAVTFRNKMIPQNQQFLLSESVLQVAPVAQVFTRCVHTPGPQLGFTHFARKKANFCVLSKILVVFCVLPIFG